METQQLAILQQRRSVGNFTDQAVPRDILLELLEYATMAPSAGNRQGWRFIIVNDLSLIQMLVNKGGSSTIGKSPCGILVTYEKYTLTPDYRDDLQTAAACIQNLLLAAQAYSLGACWVTTLPAQSTLRKIFKIPRYYSSVAYVAVGFSADTQVRNVPRINKLPDIVAENIFPMQALLARPTENGHYLKRLLPWAYRKLPASLRGQLKK
jgi:nitroreductase